VFFSVLLGVVVLKGGNEAESEKNQDHKTKQEKKRALLQLKL